MHWEILDKERIILLRQVIDQVNFGEYYMAGGTALALQLGLRKSVDFDFFVPAAFTPATAYAQLEKLDPEGIRKRNVDGSGTCDALLHGVQVSFFHYPVRLLENTFRDDGIPGLSLAGIRDIAAMKALAIGGRGAKKDFFDLYHIFQISGYSIGSLVDDLYEKYGYHHDFSYIGMGLNYFDDAEDEELPETYVDYEWDKIKEFFENSQEAFFREMGRHEQMG